VLDGEIGKSWENRGQIVTNFGSFNLRQLSTTERIAATLGVAANSTGTNWPTAEAFLIVYSSAMEIFSEGEDYYRITAFAPEEVYDRYTEAFENMLHSVQFPMLRTNPQLSPPSALARLPAASAAASRPALSVRRHWPGARPPASPRNLRSELLPVSEPLLGTSPGRLDSTFARSCRAAAPSLLPRDTAPTAASPADNSPLATRSLPPTQAFTRLITSTHPYINHPRQSICSRLSLSQSPPSVRQLPHEKPLADCTADRRCYTQPKGFNSKGHSLRGGDSILTRSLLDCIGSMSVASSLSPPQHGLAGIVSAVVGT